MLEHEHRRTVRIAEAVEDAIAMFSRWPRIGWDVDAFSRRSRCDSETSAHIFQALEQLDFIRRRPDGLYVHDSAESSSSLRYRDGLLK